MYGMEFQNAGRADQRLVEVAGSVLRKYAMVIVRPEAEKPSGETMVDMLSWMPCSNNYTTQLLFYPSVLVDNLLEYLRVS